MRKGNVSLAFAILVTVGVTAAGCGMSASSTTTTTATPPASVPSTIGSPPTRVTAPSSGALTPEAQATATGDVPDNQVFLAFSNRAAGYSLKYPEGWAQQGSGALVTFRDKNNLVRITITPAPTPSVGSVATAMQRLARTTPSLLFSVPTSVALHGAHAVKVVYSTRSAPNAVTGKRVELVVDRYYVSHAGKVAIVDLGTPRGVDNVDAYRLMIESFRWT